MCGWVVTDRKLGPPIMELIGQMKHRGSKEPSYTSAGPWDLAHVRLPIQGDVPQPIGDSSEYGRLVYNGEIFNYDTGGYKSDALWLYDQLISDTPALQRLDGFYSFAYVRWNTLHLYTDYLAQKPVYIRYDDNERLVAAASEMRGVLSEEDLIDWRKNIDPFWLSTVQKFRYYPLTDGRTWHKNVKTLPPATKLEMFKGPEWRESFGPLIPRTDFKKYDNDIFYPGETVRQELIQAIKTRIDLSDVPVSILLSGGLDSSIIYAVSKEMLGKDITTFTINNAEDQKYVSLLNPTSLEFLEFGSVSEETILRTNEGPVDLGSMEAQYLIGQAIRKKEFDVALSGDGADELFGGYRRIDKYDSQQSDVWSELVNYHLPRLDKMMMAHTVELRSPYLARPVVETALGLPYKWRTNKNILKWAFKDILPPEIIARKKEPLKVKEVREDKESHSLRLVQEWLKLHRPI